MSSSSDNLRTRRSAVQRQALAGVSREIRAMDSHHRRKYLREFSQAFRSYDSVLDSEQLQHDLQSADVILIGDYHALPASQRYAATLLEQRAMAGDRPVVLGVETIFARDQHILEEWWRREIDDAELRQRVRFELDWGYDWAPFHDLLVSARDHAEAIYGLDCMPREDLRKIGTRDRHAAAKIAEIRERHPNAVIVVLFGESHLAPGHLPRAVREVLPGTKVLTALQNIDALYWRAAGERAEKVDAVRVNDETVCIFTATPLEKYESYRLFLDQWSRADDAPDFAPTIYNLIDSLVSFLEINRYSPHNGTQPKFLVDLLPEVYGGASDGLLQNLLVRTGIDESESEHLLAAAEERGSIYLPQVNAFFVRELHMAHAAEDATRFLHQACQGLPRRVRMHGERDDENSGQESDRSMDRFCAAVIEQAVATFGSRILAPAGTDAPAPDAGPLSRAAFEKAAQTAVRSDDGEKLALVAQEWGARIGSQMYHCYLAGKLASGGLRRLFLIHLDEPGLARKVCMRVIAKVRSAAPPLARAAHA